ncbi:universal stress protein [Streptomyces sp. NPDC051940]|uniref:universal stress protein n=1 Tax=Streptomyces sp. NPDC051940 TaxID=3155675 RepID=UPI0034180E2A
MAEGPVLNRVVVGYDGSRHAERALEYAVDEALSRGAELELLCGSVPEWGRRLRGMVEDAAERAGDRAPGLTVHTTVTAEPAAVALVEQGAKAALTVVANRGHGGFAGLLLGSVGRRVAAHARMPLLVVRGESEEPRRKSPRLERSEAELRARGRVLLAVRSGADDDAVAYAFAEAERHGAEICALHAWQYPPSVKGATAGAGARSAARTAADAAVREAGRMVPRRAVAPYRRTYPDLPVTVRDECRDAAPVLVEATRQADVVVLAVHRGARPYGLQLGPVAHALLHHSFCPVVLVPVL